MGYMITLLKWIRSNFGLLVAAALFLLACGLGWDLVKIMRQLNQCQSDDPKDFPLDIPVDFSKQGEFKGTFNQTFTAEHGEAVYLRLPRESFHEKPVSEVLDGLQARMEIVNPSDGHVVHAETVSIKSESAAKTDPSREAIIDPYIQQAIVYDGQAPVFEFWPFPEGVYEIRCVVEAGVPGLKDVPQRLQARYILCGVEFMILPFGFAFLGLLALPLPIVLIVRYIRKRRSQTKTQEVTT